MSALFRLNPLQFMARKLHRSFVALLRGAIQCPAQACKPTRVRETLFGSRDAYGVTPKAGLSDFTPLRMA